MLCEDKDVVEGGSELHTRTQKRNKSSLGLKLRSFKKRARVETSSGHTLRFALVLNGGKGKTWKYVEKL